MALVDFQVDCQCLDNLHVINRDLNQLFLERFSKDYCKTKTKVITLTNHKGHRQSFQPLKFELYEADVKDRKTFVNKS